MELKLKKLAAELRVFALDVLDATRVAGNALQELAHSFATVRAAGLQIVFLGLGLRLELDEGVVGRQPGGVVGLFLDVSGHVPAVGELLLLVASRLAGLSERGHVAGIFKSFVSVCCLRAEKCVVFRVLHVCEMGFVLFDLLILLHMNLLFLILHFGFFTLVLLLLPLPVVS